MPYLAMAGTDKVTQADSFARVAQWIERLPPEQKVEGSIPFAGTLVSTRALRTPCGLSQINFFVALIFWVPLL